MANQNDPISKAIIVIILVAISGSLIYFLLKWVFGVMKAYSVASTEERLYRESLKTPGLTRSADEYMEPLKNYYAITEGTIVEDTSDSRQAAASGIDRLNRDLDNNATESQYMEQSMYPLSKVGLAGDDSPTINLWV